VKFAGAWRLPRFGNAPTVMLWSQEKLNVKRLICCAVLALALPVSSVWAQAKGDPNKTFKGYALDELSAPGLLYDPKAKATYYKALGPLSKEPWLAKLDGPSPQNKRIKVAGADFFLVSACKNRDCENNSTVLLYSQAQDVVYGKVYQRGKSTLIGTPPPAVASELEKLWKSEWRSQPK
jgi:Inhibitor of vertebrate lysozyme (Ivy)